MAAHGYAAPRPLPDNGRTWSAFLRVCHVRHYPMGQAHLPNWSDISSVLTTYDLWNADIHGRLSVCFAELLTLEGGQRKAENV
jgi:hypothetical protein